MLSQIAASCSALAVAVQLCPLPESPHVLFCSWVVIWAGGGWGSFPCLERIGSSLQMWIKPGTQAQWRVGGAMI